MWPADFCTFHRCFQNCPQTSITRKKCLFWGNYRCRTFKISCNTCSWRQWCDKITDHLLWCEKLALVTLFWSRKQAVLCWTTRRAVQCCATMNGTMSWVVNELPQYFPAFSLLQTSLQCRTACPGFCLAKKQNVRRRTLRLQVGQVKWMIAVNIGSKLFTR